jgi:FkbM family methyltransferase
VGARRTISRTIARHYPFVPLRGRLSWLNGRVEDIPRGEVVSTREGLRVRVMPDDMYYNVYFWGDYEPYNTKIYRRIVREGDVVLDVGANFGWFTALFARWVGDAGYVHSFEPVPFIHALAAETVELNGVGAQVTLNPFGLGTENATIPIFTHAGLPHGHATSADLGRDDFVRHECQILRLDDYCEQNRIVSFRFMKVDVEGFERDVFMGGTRVLSAEDAPIIAFEINSDCLRHRSLRGTDVIATLREFGYTDFFSFTTRSGIRRLEVQHVEVGTDCLVAKPTHLDELGPALHAGRLLR